MMAAVASPQQQQQDVACAEMDSLFEPVGCLGHGAFGSVFLAAKKSTGRRVVLKILNLNPLDATDCEAAFESFQRETQAVKRLSSSDEKGDDNRDMRIVCFEQSWFYQGVCAAIVMKFVNGGTLSDEIIAKANANVFEPYTERRIAWYALQLSEALAFCHERGVAHHDVKSSNVILDRSGGDGKLVLADFGSAVAPGEESVAFTKHYASPELLDAYVREEFDGLEADKIDAFGLGCILFELVSCEKLVDLVDQTLAQVLQKEGVDAALSLPCVRLPWLTDESPAGVVGYSDALKSLVKTVVEPQPNGRWRPGDLQKPLRTDCRSPLLCSSISASQTPVPGAPVTIDNIQLGMFVQRGQDWADDDADGGCGKIGVVVKLDADAVYTEVSWPTLDEPCCSRIGASNKYELQVAPSPLPDFFGGTDDMRWTGVVQTDDDTSKYSIGQTINDNCMVVMLLDDQKHILVAPTQPILIPTQRVDPTPPPVVTTVGPREPQGIPETWQPDLGLLVEVNDPQEKEGIIELFYSLDGGMDIQQVEVESIQRVQSTTLWEKFDLAKENIANYNWGLANQQRLFIGTGVCCPESLVLSQAGYANSKGFLPRLGFSHTHQFCKGAVYADRQSYIHTDGLRVLVLCRVALGKVKRNNPGGPPTQSHAYYHSEKTRCMVGRRSYQLFSVRELIQAYPEYIVAFRLTQGTHRRVVTARRPPGTSLRASPPSRPSPAAGRGQRQVSIASASPSQKNHGNTSALSAANTVASAAAAGSSTPGTPTGTSATKLCVVCLTNPVNRVLVPCGHLILCQICSSEQGLTKLRRKCPECRQKIEAAITVFGRVVDD